MVKIKYTGGISPTRIRAGKSLFDRWSRGETKEVDAETAEILLARRDFEKAYERKSTPKPEVVVEEKVEESSEEPEMVEEDEDEE